MKPSPEYVLGFFVGILAGLAILFVLYKILRKKKGPCKYDERQLLARGKAYRAAFWTLVAYSLLNGLLFVGTGIRWADEMTVPFIGVCLAATVYAVICILKDAYFSIMDRPGFYYGLFGLIMAGNLATFTLAAAKKTSYSTDGMLNFRCMNLVVVAVFAVIMITMAAKQLHDKKNAESE